VEIEHKVCARVGLRLPPASAAKPSASGRRETASVSLPSGTRLPAADWALFLTLGRSVAREISADLGWSTARRRRRGAGWRRIPAC